MLRILLLLAVLASGVLATAIHRGDLRLSPGWNPFGPLVIDAPPGPFTGMQLTRLERDGNACFAALQAAGIALERVPDRAVSEGCGWTDAGRARPGLLGAAQGFVATCPLVASLAMFERHVVAPAARDRLGTEIRRIDHLGTYACRNLYGRSTGRRSEHAGANAIDIAAFRTADGRTISVARDWDSGGPEGAFLREVHAGACRFFDVVLGPDYNRAHQDHFHLDRGRYRACS
ncbi:extensin-like domain-containing protein [Arenibaculum pallidiluteum]|uniref:extensin-like domain-containing protein n=1 Tax=Arenibaculum pallidiluteum TaxID=2812559 RepID=UPI001A972709|nr:extensin family protein [Arenibaculum pallidiluteum]